MCPRNSEWSNVEGTYEVCLTQVVLALTPGPLGAPTEMMVGFRVVMCKRRSPWCALRKCTFAMCFQTKMYHFSVRRSSSNESECPADDGFSYELEDALFWKQETRKFDILGHVQSVQILVSCSSGHNSLDVPVSDRLSTS